MCKLVKFLIVISHSLSCLAAAECDENQCTNDILAKYEPTWESLDKRPLPQWYDDAKVGIFIHWGVYAVPSFGGEWFWINWQGSKTQSYVDYMKNNYAPGFTYQDFAKDFKAEFFNATEWALLFKDSGAKYVVLTSKHHDGYALWPSKYSFSWNSKDLGPNLDIIGELSSSIREHTTIRFGLYHSLYEWFNRMYLDDKLHLFLQNEFVTKKILPELFELVNLYRPDVIWSDGEWEAPAKYWKSTEFIAWLYNDSPVRENVVTNDRWGLETVCKHGDFYTCSDRYNPGVLQPHKWENALTIDRESWGHRQNVKLKDFMTSKELIKELAVTVSCGGNILINVGPTKYGTIEPIFEERLRDLGAWLKTNGEAIYSSKPWKAQNDSFSSNVWYTSKPAANGKIYVYAIILDYPYESNQVVLQSIAAFVDATTEVILLGAENLKPTISSDSKTAHIKFPPKRLTDKNGLNSAWVLRFTI